MAKQILLNTLVNVFGEYIDGLNEENLKLGIWSGQLELKNLRLKSTGIKKLDLPVDVCHGYVGSLRVSIPWTKLSSESVTAEVSDIYMVIQPIDVDLNNADTIREKALEAKRIMLDKLTAVAKAQAAALAKEKEDKKQDDGYFARLATKIADNIYILVRNLHVRYEDPISDPSNRLSLGVMIKQFQVQSTDPNWNPSFVSREQSMSASGAIHKIVVMDDLALYWNTTSHKQLGRCPLDDVLKEMSVYSDTPGQAEEVLSYVLRPTQLLIKLIHNEKLDPRYPQYLADLDLPKLEMDIFAEQYMQSLRIKKTFDLIRRVQLLLMFRPRQSPKYNPRAWWRYAFLCVRKPREGLDMAQVAHMLTQRRRYCDLYAKVDAKQLLNAKEEHDYIQIEQQVATEVLVEWRMLAERRKAVLAKKPSLNKQGSSTKRSTSFKRGDSGLDKSKQGEPEKKSSWMSWFTPSSTPAPPPPPTPPPVPAGKEVEPVKAEQDMPLAEDDITLEDLALQVVEEERAAHGQGAIAADVKPDFELARITMSSTGCFRLYGKDRHALLELNSAFDLNASKTGDSLIAAFHLGEFSIQDKFTPTPVFPYVVRAGGDNKEKIVDLRLSMEPKATTLRMRTRPVEIAYVPSWVAKLLQLFQPPEGLTEALVNQAAENLTHARALAKDSLTQSALRVDIVISAPRIFVPVAPSRDFGFLLLDTGRLSVKGGSSPEDPNMIWDIRLSDIQSKLARKKADWLLEQENSRFQLIEPFEIGASVRIKRQDNSPEGSGPGAAKTKPETADAGADLTVVAVLKPGIKGIFTATRLKTVMYVATNLGLPPQEEEEVIDIDDLNVVEIAEQPRRLSLTAFGVAETTPRTPRKNAAPPPRAPTPPPPVQDSGLAPEHKSMDLQVEISQISLELHADEDTEEGKDPKASQLFYLAIDGFGYNMVSRPYDMTMNVTLQGMSLESLRRPADLGQYRYLAQSLPAGDATSLITVQLILIGEAKKSPIYAGFDRVMEITFSTLNFNCDTTSLLLFKPFYAAIVDFGDVVPIEVVPLQRSISGASKTSQRSNRSFTSMASAASKILVTAPKPDEPGKTLTLTARLYSVSFEILSTNSFLPVIKAEISDLSTKVQMQDVITVETVLRSFTLADTQPTSRDHAIKNLISPKPGIQEEEDEEALEKDKALLRVMVKQELGDQPMWDVDVALEDFTVNVLVGPLIYSLGVTLENIAALLEMLNVAPEEAAATMQDLGLGRNASVYLSSKGLEAIVEDDEQGLKHPADEVPPGLNVKVRLINPGLILVENPRNYDSRTITIRSSFVIHYVRTIDNVTTLEAIHFDASGLESFVDIITGGSQPVQIIEPLAIGTHVKRRSEQEKLLTTHLAVNLSNIEARVAYNDVMLLLSILTSISDGMAKVQAMQQQQAQEGQQAPGGETSRAALHMTEAWDQEGASDGVKHEVDQIQEVKDTSMTSIIAAIEGINVVFVNDYEGHEQPVLSFHVDDLQASLETVADSYRGDGHLKIQSYFFNPYVVQWEPVVEPWYVGLDLTTVVNGVICSIFSDRPLELTITNDLLRTVGRTFAILTSGEVADSSKQARERLLKMEESHTFFNVTGVPLIVDGGLGPVEVVPGASLVLSVKPVKTGTGLGCGKKLAKYTRTSGLVNVALAGPLGEQRKILQKLRTDNPGSFIYPLKPVQDTSRVYPEPVVEETWENERRDRIMQKWRPPFLPNDRPQWSDEQGKKERKRENILLPNPDWRWQDDWHVDMAYGEVGTEIDKEGWTYAVEFPGFNLNRVKRSQRDLDGVRRRRHIRTRVPRPPDFGDPCRPLYLTWTVETQPDGRTHLRAESVTKVINETPIDFNLQVFVDVGKDAHDLDPVPAFGFMSLPVMLAYALNMRIKPQEGKYGWSRNFLIDKYTVVDEVVALCEPTKDNADRPPVFVVVEVKNVGGVGHVYLRPPFVLHNYLPCRLWTHIMPGEIMMSEDQKNELSVASGQTEWLMSRVTTRTSNLMIVVRITEFDWSRPEQFAVSEELVSFYLSNSAGEEIWLSGEIIPRSQKRFEVILFSGYWVVDRTGLKLSFCENPKGKRRRARAKQGNRRLGAGDEGLNLVVLEFKKHSDLDYQVVGVDNGSKIYTDRDVVFANLPPRLRRKTCIVPPNADRNREGDSLMSFKLSVDAEVYLLYDVSAGDSCDPPSWIDAQGFNALPGQVIKINTHKEEGLIKFQMYLKRLPQGSVLELGGNKGANGTRNNYVVFLLRDLEGFRRSQSLAAPNEEDESILGMLLYHSPKKKIAVCVGDEESWSKQVDISATMEKGVFDIGGDKTTYDLCVSVDVCPGVFHRTKQITIQPRFCLVNCLDVDLCVKQDETRDDTAIWLKPHSRTPFYWTSKEKKKELLMMVPGQSSWSYGGVSIDNVGGTAVLLPNGSDKDRQDALVVHVEVKLAEVQEECGVVVAIWKPTPEEPPYYRIQNFTPHDIRFVQLDVRKLRPRWLLSRGQVAIYGWEHPTMRHKLFVRVHNPQLPDRKFCTEIDMEDMHAKSSIEIGRGSEQVHLGLVAEDGTKVLKIVTDQGLAMLNPPRAQSRKEMTVQLKLAGLGLSLITDDEDEGRREIGYLALQDVFVDFLKGTREIELEVKVRNVQLDNHVTKGIYPVILCPRTKPKMEQPFIHVSLVTDIDPAGPSSNIIRYVAFRMLAADVQLDLRSLQKFLSLFQQLDFMAFDEASAEIFPQKYIENIRDFYGNAEPSPWVDVPATQAVVEYPRAYFERVELHPLSICLSFVQTVPLESRFTIGGNLLEAVKNLAAVSRAPLKIRSFNVENAMETPSRFVGIILTHYKRQAFAQILYLAGSLTTLGNPANLVVNVGTGVKDFFYEPIQGLVHSPKEFALGLQKGTTSLLKGVVSGTLNSVAGVGDTVSRSVALLAADKDYTAQRDARRQQTATSGTGIVDGLKGGGVSLVRGLADGIGGLVTTPIKEARTGGVGGFFKGVGKGVVGVVVKPIVGVGDGVVSVIQGISQETQGLEVHQQVRRRRALPRLGSNGMKVVTAYSTQAAKAQEKVEEGDSYVCHVGLPDGTEVIFTDEYLMVYTAKGGEWKNFWREIAYCDMTDYGIVVHLYGNDPHGRGRLLECNDITKCYTLYEQLLIHSPKMGNGSHMRTLEEITSDEGEDKGTGGGLGGEAHASVAGKLEGYRFGQANGTQIKCSRRLRSWDIMGRAKTRMMHEWRTWAELDMAVWKTINEWMTNHWGLNFRKCVATIIINKASTGFHIQQIDFTNGSEYHVVDSPHFDRTSNVLASGGALLIFAWSHIPTIVKKAHVDYTLESNAFSGEFRDTKANVVARPGYAVAFLEKTKTSEFCKYVVVVQN